MKSRLLPIEPDRLGTLKRWPELTLVLLGIVLRVALHRGYRADMGYDAAGHATTIYWWTQHWAIPPIDGVRQASHPPLYYALAGLCSRVGFGVDSLAGLSVFFGGIRLGLLLRALEVYLPKQRLARLVALALAAVLPASVLSDVMLSNEAMNGAFAMAALLLLPPVFESKGRKRWFAAGGFGFVLGLTLLVKISALVIVMSVASAALVAWVREGNEGIRGRLQRLAPVACALVVMVATSGWYFAYCQRHHGKMFLTGYAGPGRAFIAPFMRKPYLERRPLRYFLGWDSEIYAFPYFPVAALPDARFFPQLVATTFVDYYNYGLAAYPREGSSGIRANDHLLRPGVLWPSRLSVAAGVLIACMTALAWLSALAECWRKRAYAMLAIVLVPWAATVGQAHFAVSFPCDTDGLVKGAYLQFAAPPLHALFGLAVAWLWQRRIYRVFAVVALAALGCVAGYTIFCIFIA